MSNTEAIHNFPELELTLILKNPLTEITIKQSISFIVISRLNTEGV